jgi:hypothetical protein
MDSRPSCVYKNDILREGIVIDLSIVAMITAVVFFGLGLLAGNRSKLDEADDDERKMKQAVNDWHRRASELR